MEKYAVQYAPLAIDDLRNIYYCTYASGANYGIESN